MGAYSRLGAIKVLFQGGVVGVGAYSRLGALSNKYGKKTMQLAPSAALHTAGAWEI